ncbi:MAG: hypothetical protein ACK5XL_01675, partial [Cyclobacteriaceae bacterium]
MFRSKIWALLPLLVFIVLYLATSLVLNDFYKMPVIVAFLIAAVVAAKALVATERQPDVRFDVKGSVALGLGSVLLL